ncbi:MAG TPA: hypothetical protein VMT76_16265 [Puia sp.]|nr:hypothetical protein [Puia sp.]
MKIKLLLLALVVGMSACYYDKEQLLTPPKTSGGTCQNYSFSTDVSPLITASCSNGSGCHGSGSTNGPGALTTYDEMKNAASQMQASILAGRMPLGSSLTSAQIQTITCWISNGTPNN